MARHATPHHAGHVKKMLGEKQGALGQGAAAPAARSTGQKFNPRTQPTPSANEAMPQMGGGLFNNTAE